jgi:hypothetical protein
MVAGDFFVRGWDEVGKKRTGAGLGKLSPSLPLPGATPPGEGEFTLRARGVTRRVTDALALTERARERYLQRWWPGGEQVGKRSLRQSLTSAAVLHVFQNLLDRR